MTLRSIQTRDDGFIAHLIEHEKQTIGVRGYDTYPYHTYSGLYRDLAREEYELQRMSQARKWMVAGTDRRTYRKTYATVNECEPRQLREQERKIDHLKRQIVEKQIRLQALEKQLGGLVQAGIDEDGREVFLLVAADRASAVHALAPGAKIKVSGILIRRGPPLEIHADNLVPQ